MSLPRLEAIKMACQGDGMEQNIRFYLRNCMIEEISEIQVEISKIFRFGPASYHPKDKERCSNVSRMSAEIGDLLAVVRLAFFHQTGEDAETFSTDHLKLVDAMHWKDLTLEDGHFLSFLKDFQTCLLKGALEISEKNIITKTTRYDLNNFVRRMLILNYIDIISYTQHYLGKIPKVLTLAPFLSPKRGTIFNMLVS